MPSCAAYDCINNSSKRPDLTFRKIPPENKKHLRKQWLNNVRRSGILPKDSSFYICSEHFDSSCFERNLQVNI